MEKNCHNCANFEHLYCPVINHEITNGYAMLAHSKTCKSFKAKASLSLKKMAELEEI